MHKIWYSLKVKIFLNKLIESFNMQTYKIILEYALKLKPANRAHLIEGLIVSMEDVIQK